MSLSGTASANHVSFPAAGQYHCLLTCRWRGLPRCTQVLLLMLASHAHLFSSFPVMIQVLVYCAAVQA